MRVIIAGGDGFCGWPTALHLSRRGYHVVIVDNLYRRKIDEELSVPSLTPITSIEERLNAWKELTGKEIPFYNMDLSTDYDEFLALIKREQPDAIVDFAKIRSAPYSMKTPKHKIETVRNNLGSAQVVLAAIVESGLDIHLVHLGTMGVYGYACPAGVIPEGYLDVFVKGQNSDELMPWKILYPASPGSVYHLTKCQEALMFQFYNKCNGVRITDLHQGIVWGTNTEETLMDERLINRFDYDGDYGTVLNRFLMQAAFDYPLTVYGTGGQKRAFIHVQDTARCIEIALQDPPAVGDTVKIFNQVTEAYQVSELAELISRLTGVKIAFHSNPRVEAAQNELVVINQQFLERGLKPITLEEGLIKEIYSIARRYKERVVMAAIPPSTKWRKDLPEPVKISEADKIEVAPTSHGKMIGSLHAVC